MVIDLKPEQQRVIDLAMESGAYQNPSEVLDQAFEIIRELLILKTGCLNNAKPLPRRSKMVLYRQNAEN